MVVVAVRDCLVHQLDVNNAFLHGFREKTRYEVQKPDQVCKFVHSLHGLKYVSRQWNKDFLKFIISLGFMQSRNDDYSLFTELDSKWFIAMLVYANDVLNVRDNLDGIWHIKG